MKIKYLVLLGLVLAAAALSEPTTDKPDEEQTTTRVKDQTQHKDNHQNEVN